MFDLSYHDYARNFGFTQSGHRYVTICPFCQHPNRKFYVTITDGLYKCFHCNAAGKWLVKSKLLTINKELSNNFDKYVTKSIDNLFNTREGRQYGLHYLLNRKLSYEIIKYFRLGYSVDDNSIVIPTSYDKHIYSVDKRFINDDNSQRYTSLSGSIKIPFNIDYVSLGGSCCMVTEGQFDCMSAIQLIPNLVTIGLPGKEVSLNKWIEQLKSFEKIYLALDMGEETITNIQTLSSLLKPYRCYRVIFPAKDLNDLLVNNPDAKQVLIQSLVSAEKLGTPLVATIGDLLPDIKDSYTNNYKSISTGFEILDSITGGHRSGELTVLLGASGKGKSTLAATLATNVARQGYKTLFGSFELSFCSEVLPKILSFLTQENREVTKVPWDQYEKMALTLHNTDSLRVLTREGVTPLTEVIDAIHIAYKEGVRFVVLDHLHYFVKADKEERLHLVEAMKSLKQLTRIYPELMIFLVVHCANPPKDWRTGKPLHVTMYNSKGASDIHQEPDNFWTLNQDNNTGVIDLTVEKLRSGKTNLIAGGNCKVYFDKSKFQYNFV